ncbi:MAG: glycosyltransferase family 4 protein [Treponema sp.]|nr:glycosyltransferase family 4 protein [Treponema sp.]
MAEGLSINGWDVRVFASNRYCRKQGSIDPQYELHHGVSIRRFNHPSFFQSKHIGRLINSFCLSFSWFFALLFVRADVIVFGTDPQFSFYIIPLLAFLRPDLRFAIWGFDLYPEAVIADGIKIPKLVKKILLWWAGVSYRRCNLLIDIGSCMRNRFMRYHPKAKYETIVPWALDEPAYLAEPDNNIRRDLFGDARLGILYSGTIGKAHQFEEFILLARELRKRNASVGFCFAGRGNCYQKLRDMISQEDSNIRFSGFVDEKMLPLRLAAADIHMISLRDGWEGVVVPSKFFGSLAAGRPLLYCGAQESCIVELITNEGLGFVVEINTVSVIADRLEEFTHNKNKIHQMQEQAFQFYNTHFSKQLQWEKWNYSLRDYIKTSH